MSQNKFVSLPVLKLKHSKILLALIVVLHATALGCVALLIYIPISIKILLAALVLFSLFYYWHYYLYLKSLKLIKYRVDGKWILGFKEKPILVTLDKDYMLTEWLIVLRFTLGESKFKSIPIFVDMLPPKVFKQLRVVLPYIPPT